MNSLYGDDAASRGVVEFTDFAKVTYNHQTVMVKQSAEMEVARVLFMDIVG